MSFKGSQRCKWIRIKRLDIVVDIELASLPYYGKDRFNIEI